MNLATSNERGVSTTTISAVNTFILSINTRVPSIVAIPVKLWVNPSKSPSENWSASAITLLTISPVECESKKLRGSLSILLRASFLISLTTL